MLYRNISSVPVWILQDSMKHLVCPGEVINLNISDINHSGSSMRFFESFEKTNIVKVNEWDKADRVDDSKFAIEKNLSDKEVDL